MMILYTLFLALLFHDQNLTQQAQTPQNQTTTPHTTYFLDDIWKVLMKVKYTYSQNSYIPAFDENIKALDGKIVTVKGFMYPIDEKTKHEFFYLSYYPVNVCFFCGGAGPESVIEVNAKQAVTLQNKAITLKGKLKLNYKDRERLFFILLDAEII